MLMLGEVHTGLLQHATSLSLPWCEQALGMFRGEKVRRFERPIAHVVSPDLLAGVDCRLSTKSGSLVRGIGTVVHRANVTGGHVLQGAAVTKVTSEGAGRRMPWSYYLARPGWVETIGKANLADLASGYLSGDNYATSILDLGAISERIMDTVQASSVLDRAAPLRTARTKLRWAALVMGEARAGEEVTFSIEDRQTRTLLLRCTDEQAVEITGLCEDLALHDWLLTTLLEIIDRSGIGAAARGDTVDRLRPAIDNLLHLWMPAARVGNAVLDLWERLERRAGLSRQWHASVDRIRDQIAVSTIALLGVAIEGSRS